MCVNQKLIDALDQWFSNASMHHNQLKALWKQSARPHAMAGEDPRMCISDKGCCYCESRDHISGTTTFDCSYFWPRDRISGTTTLNCSYSSLKWASCPLHSLVQDWWDPREKAGLFHLSCYKAQCSPAFWRLYKVTIQHGIYLLCSANPDEEFRPV